MNFQKISIIKDQFKVKYTTYNGDVHNIDIEGDVPNVVKQIFSDFSICLTSVLDVPAFTEVLAEEVMIANGLYRFKGHYYNDFLAAKIQFETPFLSYNEEFYSRGGAFAVRDNGEVLPYWGRDIYEKVQSLIDKTVYFLDRRTAQITIDDVIKDELSGEGNEL
jgi:hypothetical protein